MRRRLLTRMIDVREPEIRLLRPSAGMQQMMMGGGDKPWVPGPAYYEDFGITIATIFGNSLFKGQENANGLGIYWGSGTVSFDIAEYRSSDDTLDRFQIVLPELLGAASRHSFDYVTVQGTTYTVGAVKTFSQYYNDGKGGSGAATWQWETGTNGVTVNLLTDGASTLRFTAYVLDAAGTLTIGAYSSVFGLYGATAGSWSETKGDVPHYLYYITTGTTILEFAGGLNGSPMAKYYGPTLKARYNGVITEFTQQTIAGAQAIIRYQATGDPFNLNGNTGSTRDIEFISVGSP
jgi:hypothetical protein